MDTDVAQSFRLSYIRQHLPDPSLLDRSGSGLRAPDVSGGRRQTGMTGLEDASDRLDPSVPEVIAEAADRWFANVEKLEQLEESMGSQIKTVAEVRQMHFSFLERLVLTGMQIVELMNSTPSLPPRDYSQTDFECTLIDLSCRFLGRYGNIPPTESRQEIRKAFGICG